MSNQLGHTVSTDFKSLGNSGMIKLSAQSNLCMLVLISQNCFALRQLAIIILMKCLILEFQKPYLISNENLEDLKDAGQCLRKDLNNGTIFVAAIPRIICCNTKDRQKE